MINGKVVFSMGGWGYKIRYGFNDQTLFMV